MSLRDDLTAGAALADLCHLADVPHERLRMFLDEALPYRTLTIQISPADERRLRRNIDTFNRDTPEDPMCADCEDDLAIVVAGCMTRALDAMDDDDRVWSDIDGRAYDLPRPKRLPLVKRLRHAWRVARREWRAS